MCKRLKPDYTGYCSWTVYSYETKADAALDSLRNCAKLMVTTFTGNTHFLQLVRTSGCGPIIADQALTPWIRAPVHYWRLRTEETSFIA